MAKKVLLIINPYSGKGQIKNQLLDIIDQFIRAGFEVSVHITQEKGDAVKVSRKNATKYDLIVCSGGDGTFNELINGIMACEKKPYLGYIPAGTTNDFASSLGLSKNMQEAAQNIISGIPFPCDMGSFNDKYFTYVAAFGLFTNVAYETPQEVKNILGHLAYILEGIKQLTTIKSYHLTITHDGEKIEGDFIFGMVTSSTSVGGFKGLSGPDVRLDDGLFEVSLIKTPRNPLELNGIISCLLKQEPNPDFVYFFKTAKVHIDCDEIMPWTLDGEYGGDPDEVDIKNIRLAVNFVK